jgi:hypothetical protein
MREMKHAYRIYVSSLKPEGHARELGIDGVKILKCIFNKCVKTGYFELCYEYLGCIEGSTPALQLNNCQLLKEVSNSARDFIKAVQFIGMVVTGNMSAYI